MTILAALKAPAPRIPKAFERLGLSVLITIFVLRWWHRFLLTPDAGYYLTAAINFVRHGKFFVYLNWPVRTMLPGTQLYADFPPGFPTFLSAFLFIFRDPMIGAGIAQSLALITLYYGVYRATSALEMDAPYKLLTVAFVGLFTPHRISLTALLTEPLYIALCFAVLLAAIEIAKKGDSRVRWALAGIFLFCAAGTRWNGFACIFFFLVPLFQNQRHLCKKLFFLGAAGALPILLWFTRNYFSIGTASKFYGHPQLLLGNLTVPFVASVLWWGHGSVLLALAIFAFAFLPLLIRKLRELPEQKIYLIVGAGAIGQFLIIYGLSLVVLGMTPVDDRYLMPAYFLFSVALFYALNLAVRLLRLERMALLAGILLGIVGAGYGLKKAPSPGTWFTRGVPVEEKLWIEIRTRPYFKSATHFYSSQNHLHQIFALIPQVVLWNEKPSEEDLKAWLKQPNSFFVIAAESPLIQQLAGFDQRALGLQKEMIEGFTIYFK
jgi:hypothetical protein